MQQPVPALNATAREDGMLAAGLVLVCGMLLMLSLSRHGVGLNSDSLFYLDAAGRIAQGQGVSTALPDDTARPFVTWPPLYPVALAVGPLLGLPAALWAGVLHCALFALTALGALVLLRWAGAGRLAAASGGVVVVLAGSMLQAFHMALSEALFLPLWLALIGLLARAMTDMRHRWIIAAGLCGAAATLTRYVAQGSIPAAALLLALCPGVLPWRARLVRAALFFACAQVPVLLWLGRNYLVADSVAQRGVALEAIQAGWFFDLWRVATTWFVPQEWNRWPRHLITLALLASFAAGLKGALAGPEADRRRARRAIWPGC